MTGGNSAKAIGFPGGCLRALALAALLIAGWLTPATAVRADEPGESDRPDPAARLQLVIKSVHIHDDQDWGEGDITINVYVWQVSHRQGCTGAILTDECILSLASSMRIEFDAEDGDTVQLNRTVPERGGFTRDASVSPEIGFPLLRG